MSQPRIRHLAIISREPAKLSEFYQSVFEMELIRNCSPPCKRIARLVQADLVARGAAAA